MHSQPAPLAGSGESQLYRNAELKIASAAASPHHARKGAPIAPSLTRDLA
jgi:hypothetical protein